MRKWCIRLLRMVYIGLIASLPVAAMANYAVTVGSGTTFGSIVIGGVHFVSMLMCDAATANQCAAVSAGGAVKVDGSAVTQPVSGTFWQATQPVSGTFWQTTQPVSAASLPLPTGAATSALQTTGNTNLATINATLGSPFQAGGSIGNSSFGITSQYPAGSTAITASATGTTGATTATLAGTSGKTTYMCWSSVRANATAATTVTDTITGVVTGTLSALLWVAPAARGIGVDEMVYNPCVPASAQNTGIAVVSGAPGSGGSVTVRAGGYQL